LDAQELKINSESSTELTKLSKKGRYGGTYLVDDKVSILYVGESKKEGVQVERYDFDNQMNFENVTDNFIDDATASEEYAWYLPKEKVEALELANEKFIQAGRNFGGGMKFELGRLVKNYNMGFFIDFDFEEEEKLKAKTGEIWRIIPSGFKTTTDVDALKTSNGFYEELQKYGNPLLAPAKDKILATGTITEKVSIKNPPKTNGNRVAVMAIDGQNFDNTQYNIYILPFSAGSMGSGLGQEDHLCSVFAPLNAPSTVKEHKHLLWKEKKDHFIFMRFNDDYELVDSTMFISDLLWGRFEVYNGLNSSFLVGLGKNDFDGWARNLDVKKLDCIQVTRFKDQDLVFSKVYTVDELEEKMVVPGDVKPKFSFTNHTSNRIREIIPLPNGDAFLIGQSPVETYGIQLTPDGMLKAFYLFPRIDDKKSRHYNYQVMFKGNNMYLVLNEQPYELTNETQVSTSTTTVKGAYVTTTTTSTTVKKLNEVFVQSQLVRINVDSQEMSNRVLINGKDYYAMGSFPALFTKNAIYFSGRDKGPKGKTIYVSRIDI
jgi:hypothetical protein